MIRGRPDAERRVPGWVRVLRHQKPFLLELNSWRVLISKREQLASSLLLLRECEAAIRVAELGGRDGMEGDGEVIHTPTRLDQSI